MSQVDEQGLIQVGIFKAHRHSFVIPDVIDAQKTAEQANKRWKESQESTVVHFHKSDESCLNAQHHMYPLSTTARG